MAKKISNAPTEPYNPFDSIGASLAALAPALDPVQPSSAPKREPAKSAKTRARPAATEPAPAEPVVVASTPKPPPMQPPEASRGVEVTPPSQSTTTSVARPAPKAPSPSIQKRFKTTRQDATQQDLAAVRLGAQLGVNIDFSKLTRALWDVYLRHEEEILRTAPDDEVWERPPNSDTIGLAALDERLGDLVNDGLLMASFRANRK